MLCCFKHFNKSVVVTVTVLKFASVIMKRTKPKARNIKSRLSVKCSSLVSGSKKFQVLPTPVKSLSDKKEYRVIRLSNGLTACLICDFPCIKNLSCSDDDDDHSTTSSESSSEEEDQQINEENDGICDEKCTKKISEEEPKMAAAALCVGVGSFSDPKNIQGLAHFLEHMVFMGSEKFPEENDFDSFIKKRGGSDNASTDCETTTFYFECLEKHLCRGLDKFAQFFISPLLKKSSMTREREAIDSEFQMALPLDSYRKEQLLSSFAKPESPVNGFTWGNLVSLKENVSDEELYKGLHKFRKRHYSAHRMTLAVQARLPMQLLENYVVDCFSKVPNNEQPPDDLKSYAVDVFDTPEFYRMYYMKSTKDLYQVDLTWALPSLLHKYKNKPHQYISWLLGYEGKGSILSYLKKKVWSLGIFTGNAESGMEHNSLYAVFSVSIILTKEGLVHLFEVIEAVFSYINMLKKIGPQERIFNEIKLIEDTSFRFAEEEPAIEMVENIVESMQYFPPEDYITGSELYFEYSPEDIKMVMDHLRPEKLNVLILSNKAPEGVIYDKVEKWFGTEYAEREIPKDWVKKWQNVKPFKEFFLPEPNPYLTKDFSILDPLEKVDGFPQKIAGTPGFELWYKQDSKFNLPIAYYNICLVSPFAVESPLTVCMIDMLVNQLLLHLTEDVYPASTAGFTLFMAPHERGVILKFNGYNQKLPLMIDMVSNHLKSFKSNMTTDLFDAVKDKLVKSYHNKLLKPSILATQIRLDLLLNHFCPFVERAQAINEVTFDRLQKFADEFFAYLYVKALVQGNVTAEVAKDTIGKFVETLGCKPLLKAAYPQYRVVQIPTGERCIQVRSFNKKDSNSIISNYYQIGPFSLDDSVRLELVLMIIEEPLFDVLRTKEQLGYDVSCNQRDTYGVIGYTITVNTQATKYTTEFVDQRIEEFLKSSHQILSSLSEKKFSQFKRNLIKVKLSADVHLREEVDRNWAEMVSEDYLFNRYYREVDVLRELQLQDLRKWWISVCSHDNPGYRKITIQVVGHDTKKSKMEVDQSAKELTDDDLPESEALKLSVLEGGKESDKPDGYYIKNINDFKANLFLHPAGSNKQ